MEGFIVADKPRDLERLPEKTRDTIEVGFHILIIIKDDNPRNEIRGLYLSTGTGLRTWCEYEAHLLRQHGANVLLLLICLSPKANNQSTGAPKYTAYFTFDVKKYYSIRQGGCSMPRISYGRTMMPGYGWIIIVVVAIVIVVAIIRSASGSKGDYRKQQPGLSFGKLDRALQKDHVRRETAEFTIAIDMGEIDAIDSEDYDLATEKVREVLVEAEEARDTVVIANMMGYLEKIELAKKRRF